jgi:hypothetical protein
MNANMHWSEAKEAHEKIAHKIDPSLNEPSFTGYIFKAYFLAPFIKRFKTKSMRLARKKKEANQGNSNTTVNEHSTATSH